jgi:hypothetical protein
MKKIITPLLLLSAVFVTPAYANFISNPALGINLNVGSAPNPTPNDIRENRKPVLAGAINPVPAKGALVLSEVPHKAAPAAPAH